MRTPLVSVVMPLYNKGVSVENSIRSVLSQTEGNFELVVVNDGSTDGSDCVVQRIKDNRIRLINQINGGEGAARNRGISEAKADLIAFLDADDEWMPNFLNTVLNLEQAFPEAGAFATAFVGCRDGKIIRLSHADVELRLKGEILVNYFKSCTLGSNMVWSSSALFRKTVFDAVGVFPVGVRNGADLHMWARIAMKYPVAWSPLECAVWHLSAENRCAGMVVMPDVPFADVVIQAINDKQLSPEMAYWAHEYLCKFRLFYSEVAMEHGQKALARALLKKAKTTTLFKKKWRKLALRYYTPAVVLGLKSSIRAMLYKS